MFISFVSESRGRRTVRNVLKSKQTHPGRTVHRQNLHSSAFQLELDCDVISLSEEIVVMWRRIEQSIITTGQLQVLNHWIVLHCNMCGTHPKETIYIF